jgi:oligopeptidase A
MNPLLASPDSLPRFDEIRAEHVGPAIAELVAAVAAGADALERDAVPTWAGLVARLTALTEPLGWAWGVVNHLMSVRNADDLRAAHEAAQPAVVETLLRLEQSVPIYRGLRALRDGAEWAGLDAAQRRVVTRMIRDAELAGVALEGAARERFQAIELELAELATTFANHLLDATKAFGLTLTQPDEVAGLPPTLLAMAAQAARKDAPDATAERGPWRITLDAPIYGPFLEHCRRRDLRETVYRAVVTRASAGEHDNSPIIEKILRLRQEKAALLGYASYADLSLASKMTPGVAAAERLLSELRAAALPRARAELAELTDYARRAAGDPALELALWDAPFWAERLREERYAYTEEELRPYFPLEQALADLFATAGRLFGVSVRPADGEAPVWHESVRFFRVADDSGRDVAAFYLDPYIRPAEKRGGAWMNPAIDKKAPARAPVAYLVLNASEPTAERPALLAFHEVETLFHEFGHGLQHMLTTVPHPEAAGLNGIEWDAVELPSQFMENWCYHLDIGRHYRTGERLPRALADKLRAAKNYRAGSVTLRQVYFATLDLELHHRWRGEPVVDVQRRVAADNTVVPPLPEDRFLCSFAHIFAGGYAAGYFSYKAAEVLSADAYGAFLEAGDAHLPETGRRFRDTVLALGGGEHPLEVFRRFRGREPSTRPLLEQSGLVDEQAQ